MKYDNDQIFPYSLTKITEFGNKIDQNTNEFENSGYSTEATCVDMNGGDDLEDKNM